MKPKLYQNLVKTQPKVKKFLEIRKCAKIKTFLSYIRYLVMKKFLCYITKSKIKKFANVKIIIS